MPHDEAVALANKLADAAAEITRKYFRCAQLKYFIFHPGCSATRSQAAPTASLR